jgi:hypothetical protein
MGNPVEPASERLPTHFPGVPGEDEEGRLEGVIRVGGKAEFPPTNGSHHRPVPVNNRRERVLILAVNNALHGCARLPITLNFRGVVGERFCVDRQPSARKHTSHRAETAQK